ncbi:Sister chromatid cohesion complex Cohesin, subunit RAD21/SCC1 [Handroanthus impetiginosus]|uniref:Sister chromatid cohesion complex Cohesin, subunit RAD21/SCC1 n=1 Tax=Handroanthus impetiginosus TaxID=429701 RepID=A0A2G9GA98_9LAMI|nr:Sister chromatid cohesion complex Cohesin, subunit RAD21/SCC1 [Handroanthus impetiginosus]
MDPEVPIALRMSGHLLLGVVRIYSKQVDYLFEDCNVIRITINRVFTSVSVNLPEDATHAPFHSITLPERFELDNLELDDTYDDLLEDAHLKSLDDITLTEQIPTGEDPYIVINFDEQDLRGSPFVEDDAGTGPVPMEEEYVSHSVKFNNTPFLDVPPPVEVDTTTRFEDLSPSAQFGADDKNVGSSTPRDFPSIEIMRDARHGFDFNNSPILPDRAEPDKFLEEQINKDKETSTPVMEEVVLPDGCSSSPQNREEQHSSGHLGSEMLFEHRSPEMEIQPTPPVAQPKVRRRRKRKQFYDEITVLSNEFMKKALNDTSDICRVKKNSPLSSLAIWKRNNQLRLRKDGILVDLFITGSCADLRSMYKEDIIPRRLVITEEMHQETNAAQTPLSRHESDVEIEILRNNEYASPERFMPSLPAAVPSPDGRSYFTPDNPNMGLQSERLEMTEADEISPTADMGVSTGNLDSEMKTPDTFHGNGLQAEHTALSDIPELVPSAGDLEFLAQDENSPAGSEATPEHGTSTKNQGTPELQALSSRTRAVAEYLKRQSSATPIPGNSEESSGDLNLDNILEGKTRKICARMLFETLVLKQHGLVDINQEKPYGPISLKVTPKLSKEEFSV